MFYVYTLTNRKHGTLYTGVTNNLPASVDLHRNGLGSTFHRLFRLVCALPFATGLETDRSQKSG
jgi:putative endonuclease